MNKLILLLLGFCISCSFDSKKGNSPSKAEGIVLVVPPNEKDKNLKSLASALEKKVGLSVHVRAAKDYADLIAQLKSNSANFAVLPPMVAVRAEKEIDLKFLLKKVYGSSDFYFSAILVRSDASYQSLSALKSKKIAFVDPNSSSGFLYPLQLFHAAGLEPKDIKYEFSGTHDKSVELLLGKSVEAVGVWAAEPEKKEGAWTQEQFKKKSSQLRVLEYSHPIPNDAFVVLKSYYEKKPAQVLKLMDALIALSEDSTLLKEIFGVDSLTTATKRHYDSVRNLERFLKKVSL